jgi:hypothetical protein
MNKIFYGVIAVMALVLVAIISTDGAAPLLTSTKTEVAVLDSSVTLISNDEFEAQRSNILFPMTDEDVVGIRTDDYPILKNNKYVAAYREFNGLLYNTINAHVSPVYPDLYFMPVAASKKSAILVFNKNLTSVKSVETELAMYGSQWAGKGAVFSMFNGVDAKDTEHWYINFDSATPKPTQIFADMKWSADIPNDVVSNPFQSNGLVFTCIESKVVETMMNGPTKQCKKYEIYKADLSTNSATKVMTLEIGGSYAVGFYENTAYLVLGEVSGNLKYNNQLKKSAKVYTISFTQ